MSSDYCHNLMKASTYGDRICGIPEIAHSKYGLRHPFTAPPADTTALRALEDLHWIVDEITEKLNDHELAGRILDNVVKLEAAIQDAPQRCDVAQEACVQMDSGINWDVCDTHVRVDDNGQLVAAEFQQPAEDEA